MEGGVEIGDDHLIGGAARLGENPAVGIEDHGIAGANLVIIDTDAIAEEEEEPIVVGAGRQPAHKPASSFGSIQFCLDRRRILKTTLPERGVDRAHGVGAAGAAAARLMGSKENFGPEKRGDPDILDDVVVVTGQDSDAAAVRRIEDGVLIARLDEGMDESVKLAVARIASIGHGDEIAVVDGPVGGDLNEASTDGHLELARPLAQLGRRGAVGNRLGEGPDLLIGEVADMPVAGETHLWEDDHLSPGRRGLLNERVNPFQIGRFISWKMLKLNAGDSNVSHLSPDRI